MGKNYNTWSILGDFGENEWVDPMDIELDWIIRLVGL